MFTFIRLLVLGKYLIQNCNDIIHMKGNYNCMSIKINMFIELIEAFIFIGLYKGFPQ